MTALDNFNRANQPSPSQGAEFVASGISQGRAAGDLPLNADRGDARRFQRLYRAIDVYIMPNDTHPPSPSFMRTNIDIDDKLIAEAQKASGQTTKKATVEQGLRLIIKLRRQKSVDAAFGRYRWRGSLARSRTGRGAA